MDLSGSVHKMFRVAAATGGLLVLACLQAGPANSANTVFTEKWQQKYQCKDIPTKTCNTFGGGSLNFEATFAGTSCRPSDLDAGSRRFIEFALTSDSSEGVGSDSTGGFEEINNSVDDFALQVFARRSVATLRMQTRVCNPPNSNCRFVDFEKVRVTINASGDITISGSATTGSNFSGADFAESIDALNFVGMKSGDITDTVFLSFSIASDGSDQHGGTTGTIDCFESEEIPVKVTGSVKTVPKTGTNHGLSTIKLKGTL